MELLKTTILPTDDKALALKLFKHAVYDTPRVLLVVVGTGAAQDSLVQRADKLAGKPDDPRWVIWARDPSAIKKEVGKFKGQQVSLAQTRAFSLSLTDTVCDVIGTAEPEPDLVRILQAYLKAES